MTEDEARRRLTEYLGSWQGKVGFLIPKPWFEGRPELRHLKNGDWLALPSKPSVEAQAALQEVKKRDWFAPDPEIPIEGILLKSDGTAYPFFGALGKLVPHLGWPASREYFLASTSFGRYQIYEKGMAIWEGFSGWDFGYPVRRWESTEERARSCSALVAFFDLRGFTKWSDSKGAAIIQDVIEKLELSFQDAFSRPWFRRLFAKSTGDGFMVVSEGGWYETDEKPNDSSGFQAGHVKAFCLACAETVRNAALQIPKELAMGCGITTGMITQLYLLGRLDYIGPPVNESSNIQAMAYNELCISDKIIEYLKMDGVRIEGRVLPGKGMRVSVEQLHPAAATNDPKLHQENGLSDT